MLGFVLLTLKSELKKGGRDNLNVDIEYQTTDGSYHKVPKGQILSYIEGNLNIYEVVLHDITSDKVKSIILTYSNDFNLPTPPSEAIARGLQKAINDAALFGRNPISNKARDDMKAVMIDMGIDEESLLENLLIFVSQLR